MESMLRTEFPSICRVKQDSVYNDPFRKPSRLFATCTQEHRTEWRGTLGSARPCSADVGFHSLLCDTLPLQMAPAMNSATANKADAITKSRLTNVFRDMWAPLSLP